ncbi:hypothetical protein CLIM01_01003 [Colletotrichum limetticola]|uniref:Uncharacterized protein n=1 Tax=Colletotrichum limetticola TaxID=1209924 RepID=A0ABQ9QCT0_9PEZI|nr:hypothetical protein CLIM01_01003 [Colletotrichum limetticola]
MAPKFVSPNYLVSLIRLALIKESHSSSRRFSFPLSPASKAAKRALSQRSNNRRSFDSQASSSTLGNMPVVEVESYLTAPAVRWSTANRI